VAVAGAAPVKPGGVSGQQSSQHGGNWNVADAAKQIPYI